MAHADPIVRAVVHGALAAHLGIEVEAIDHDQRLDRDLGLDAFDLVLVALRLEDRAPERGEFPVGVLDPSMTVRELAALYLSWAAPSEDEGEAPDTLRVTPFSPPSVRESQAESAPSVR
jgi:Phosphopantetheine attachment site